MKWIQEQSGPNHVLFSLVDEEKKLLDLNFNTLTSSARLQYADTKRVFMVRKEGFFKNKIALCNEYGIRLSKLVYENDENEIEFNKEKFNYTLGSSLVPRLTIYKHLSSDPLLRCAVPGNMEGFDPFIKSGLILTTCWFIFTGLPKPSLQTAPGPDPVLP
jgi:hypothetical protein